MAETRAPHNQETTDGGKAFHRASTCRMPWDRCSAALIAGASLLAAIVPLSFVCMALSNRERRPKGFEGPAQLPGGIETARGGIRPSR
jgi:hypothetical protein